MINNDVLRSIRYMLDLSDTMVIDIAKQANADLVLDRTQIQSFLKKEDEPGFAECSDVVLAHFLDGLVIHRRGPAPGKPARPVEKRMTNNIVLKKLRVAFELQDADMHQAFEEVGFPVSKPELSAFFRQADHRNYRACGDQILRNFLKGLTLMVRAA
ncbi:MAG TPA: DUF1456 family protein [Pseudomonadota bacterium]|nr:DUF1456 family protein [Rhodanobacteraceae bacterium]MBP9154330.1 DUF1456 family protein [Xanthomonadales bacterium]HQW82038.1 DUF1456 family protein [Pseudomonadota bacterium]